MAGLMFERSRSANEKLKQKGRRVAAMRCLWYYAIE